LLIWAPRSGSIPGANVTPSVPSRWRPTPPQRLRDRRHPDDRPRFQRPPL